MTPNTHTTSEDLRLATEKVTFERTFTTASKHRQGTIRRTCLAFMDRLKQEGYSWLPVEEAKDLFSDTVDKWDRLTLKAYFGSQKGMSKQRMRRTARYASGQVGVKDITLEQKVPERKGYLEKLGLVEYEYDAGKGWMLCVNLENPLCSEMGLSSTSASEGDISHAVSMPNLSLSHLARTDNISSTFGMEKLVVDRREKRESV